MKTRFFILLLLQAKLLHAQSTSTEIGARAAAMGYTSSTLHDEWSLFNNVGGLGKIKQASTNVAYEIKPSLTGANRMAASFLAPAKFGSIGLGVFRFGDDIYNEHLVSFGYGNQIGNTSLGAKVNYIQYRAENFGTYNAFSLDFGGITQITNQISVGAHITNLTQSKLTGTDGERLPTKLVAGIGFQPSERVFLSTEIEKDLDYQSTWKAGMEYNFYKKVFFRSGFNLNPNAAFFGVGLFKKNIKADYAIRYNQLLGWSHQFSVSYLFGSAK
jgi:hypothetical protein